MRRKAITAATIDTDDGRTISATINTDGVDREGEVVLPAGADLRAYKKNPVVLLAHDYSAPPIGSALSIRKNRRSLTARVQFADTPLGLEIASLYAAGHMRAFSIGFEPDRSSVSAPTKEELAANPEWRGARAIIREWTLLEFSAVSVPANPAALALSVSKGDVRLSRELAVLLGLGAHTKSIVRPRRTVFAVDLKDAVRSVVKAEVVRCLR